MVKSTNEYGTFSGDERFSTYNKSEHYSYTSGL